MPVALHTVAATSTRRPLLHCLIPTVLRLMAGPQPETQQITLADTYTDVHFTGAISPGNANVQPPFSTSDCGLSL
jgi:hypothetical protein